MKKLSVLFVLVSLCLGIAFSAGCNETPDFNNEFIFKENGVTYKKLSDEQCAVGITDDLKSGEAVFIPGRANGFEVVRLGWKRAGFGIETNNVMTVSRVSELKIYFPSSIRTFYEKYFYCVNSSELFCCGDALDFEPLIYGGHATKIYVPSSSVNKYRSFMTDEKYKNAILAANVCYRLNYSASDEYYYVDNAEYGEIIRNVPPEPKRDGYTFRGWYTETECENEWIFEQSRLPVLTKNETFIETELYAKWEKTPL